MKLYRCPCPGCKNVLNVKHMICLDCFLYCDPDVNKWAASHKMKIRLKRRRRR
jgi:hypothetical protein